MILLPFAFASETAHFTFGFEEVWDYLPKKISLLKLIDSDIEWFAFIMLNCIFYSKDWHNLIYFVTIPIL